MVFLNSIQGLFNDTRTEVGIAQRSPTSENLGQSILNQQGTTYSNIEITCESKNDQFDVDSAKLRLSGTICNLKTSKNIDEIKVTNAASQKPATVFIDYQNKVFSTDYLDIAPGTNPIEIMYFNKSKLVSKTNLNIIRH